jgi:regulator of cell morphogenesis and NO signaling
MTTGEDKSPHPLTPDTVLATIALRSDAYAAVLDRHRLDFCCGGKRTLSQACTAAGLDVAGVLAELDQAARDRTEAVAAAPSDETVPLDQLVQFIFETHHAFTRAAIARIVPLAAKVLTKHGEAHPELVTVEQAFTALAADLLPHLVREERVLFPYIRTLARGAAGRSAVPVTRPPFGSVQNPVRMMMYEHDAAGDLLDELRKATGDFVAPEGACGSYRALYAALAELRSDLMRHISLENNVLFPRAIALEDQVRALWVRKL